MTFLPQFVAIGGQMPGHRLFNTEEITTDIAIVDLAANNSTFLGTGGTGTGYTLADVGAPFTVNGGNPTVRTAGVITSVNATAGTITGAEITTIGRYPTIADVPRNASGSVGQATISGGHGTGGQVIYDYSYTPFMLCRNACGFPNYFKQITVSMWYQGNGSSAAPLCDLQYLKKSGSLYGTFWNALSVGFGRFEMVYTPGLINSYTIGELNMPTGTNPRPTLGSHLLVSWDTMSGTCQCYVDDARCPTNITDWMPAPFYGINPFDTVTPNQWRLNSYNDLRYYAPIGVASFWASPVFLDLDIESNRRMFIQADRMPVDFSTYPTAPIHLYTMPGEGPSAFATNRGTGGAWQMIGEAKWQGNTMAIDKAGNYAGAEHETQRDTPITQELNGVRRSDDYNDLMYMNNTIRPGATLLYTGITEQPAHGTVTLTSGGQFTYTPNPGYTGDDQFRYSVTEEMVAPYQWPGFVAQGTALITVDSQGSIDELKLVALLPFEAPFPYDDYDSSFYGIECNWIGFDPAFPQFTLTLWCCEKVDLVWEQGTINMTPTQCVVSLQDINGDPLFDATFINQGEATKEYLILFSIDTATQQFSCFGNKGEWLSTNAVFHSNNMIGNTEP